MEPDAPVIREDIADKNEVGHGPRTHPNHIFTWEAGDKAAADAAFESAAVTVREEILNPRVHPCPLETCGCVASFNKATGDLTLYMTTQAPHLVRTVLAMLSGIAESKIRVVGGDIGGGFGNKVPVYPGYVVAIVASIVTGVPVKWIESRIDNISTTGFARDYHGVGELAADKDGRIKGLRFTALADHGAFNSHVSATKLPAGLFSICTGSYAIPNAYCSRRRGLHQQGAGRRGVPLLAARDRGGVPDRAHDRRAGAEARHRQGRDPAPQLRAGRAVPVHHVVRLDARLAATTTPRCDKVLKAVDYEGLRSEQAAKRADPNCPTLMGIGIVDLHRDRRRRADARCATSSASACSTAARSACTPPAA